MANGTTVEQENEREAGRRSMVNPYERTTRMGTQDRVRDQPVDCFMIRAAIDAAMGQGKTG